MRYMRYMSGQGHIAIHDMEGPRIRLVQIYTPLCTVPINTKSIMILSYTSSILTHISESPALLEIERGEASELIP